MNCTEIVRHKTNNFGAVFNLAKFTFKDKLWAVKEYEKGTLSFRDIGKQLGTGHKTIQKWFHLYQSHGEDSLRKSYTNYTAAFKMEVLKYMDDHWVSVNETAARFKIPDPSTILAWRRAVDTEGMEALLPKKKGRPPMTKDRKKNKPVNQSHESLIEEVERLRITFLAYLRQNFSICRNSKVLNILFRNCTNIFFTTTMYA